MNAVEPLLARLHGDRPAIVADGAAISAGDLGERTARMAAWLADLGVGPGHRVVMLVPPGPDFAAALLGLVQVGAAAVLVEPGQAPEAWKARVRSVSPDFVLADPRLKWVWRIPGLDGLLRRRGRPIPPRPEGTLLSVPRHLPDRSVPVAPRSPDDEALLLFTSGTTAAPRAVVHTHGNLPHFLAHIAALVDGLQVDSYLAETPQQIFYALLLDATCHVISGTGEARVHKVHQTLREQEIRAWFGSPWTWTRWLREGRPLPTGLRTVLLGSAPVTRPFLRQLRDGLGDATVRCVYGLTEVGPVTWVDARDKIAFAGDGDLVGTPLDGVQLRIVEGRVQVASPALAGRYLPDGPVGPWLETGDLGAISGGQLVLQGRAKDMILRRAVNHYPGVLEPVLAEHFDEVALIGVWDEAAQDERIVLATVGEADPDLSGILGEAAPDHRLALDALPRSGRQHKVDRKALRVLARAQFAIPGEDR